MPVSCALGSAVFPRERRRGGPVCRQGSRMIEAEKVSKVDVTQARPNRIQDP